MAYIGSGLIFLLASVTLGQADAGCTSYHTHMFNTNTNSSNVQLYAEQVSCYRWKVGRWVTFTNYKKVPLRLAAFSREDNSCVQMNQCGGGNPWYVKLSDDESWLCMTNVTSNHTEQCCLNRVGISVRTCGEKTIYRLNEPIALKLCGGVCLVQDELEQLPSKFLTHSGWQQRQWYDRLTNNFKDSLVTVTFAIERRKKEQYKEKLTIEAFQQKLLSQWNAAKPTPKLREDNFYNLYHSPNTVEFLTTYSFYLATDDGNPIPQDQLLTFLDDKLHGVDVTGDGISYIYIVERGGAKDLLDHPSPTKPATRHQHKLRTSTSSHLPAQATQLSTSSGIHWTNIIIILGVASGLALVALISAAIYRQLNR